MKKIALLLFVCLYSLITRGQDFSNKGKLFYITYPAHIDATNSAMGIYITSDVDASGTVTVGTTTLPYTVNANNVKRIFLGPNASGDAPNTGVYLDQFDGIKPGAAIKVTSDKPVVVYAHIIRSARSAATLVLPVTVWGREYIMPSYQNQGSSASYGTLSIVASDSNTVVEITPTVASRDGVRAANVPFQITIPVPGDAYQLQFASNADLSGTIVKSVASGTGGCKRIAVFAGTTWSGIGCTNASGGDNLYQQLFPTGAWGKQFLTAPFKTKTNDIIRVFVKDPTTVVTKTENGITTTLTGLTTNKFYEFTTGNPTLINADKAISVVMYIKSQSCQTPNVNSDPEMVVINPVEQTVNNITVFSAHQNYVPSGQSAVTSCYLNIIIKTAAISNFKINNTAPTGTFIAIPGTQYSYLQQDVTSITLTNPVQNLKADSSFIAIAYGFGNVESYGYNAGTNVTDLYQYVTLQNPFATVNFPATCKGTPFKFSITLPYQPTSLFWDFGNNPNLSPNAIVSNSSPVPDSSFVKDARTLYVYKLPSDYVFSASGTYPVKVLANNPTSDGCNGLQEINYDVVVYDKPIADFTFTHSGCVTDSVKFFDATNGFGRPTVKWKWEFGDALTDSVKNPVHKYASPGTGSYNVKFTSITDIGCITDTTKAFAISSVPAAKFGISDTLCVNKTINLTDTSTIAVGTIVKWYWDYGNGVKDTLTTNAPRTVTYPSSGTYTVTLKVQSSTGCMSPVFAKTFIVRDNPVPDFSLPIVCLPVGAAQFINLTTIPDGTLATVTYKWDFGDATPISTLTAPLHNYASTGPFSIKLTATSQYGCIKDTTKQLTTVYPAPTSSFTVTPEVCLRDSALFTDAGNPGAGNSITKWYWNRNAMGGGSYVDTVQNFKYRYGAAGTYQVKMYFKTDKGCISDTGSQTIVVNPLPTAAFISTAPLCETRAVTFTTQSTPSVGNIVRWYWNMGNSSIYNQTTSAAFNENYATWGPYTVKHMVETNKGCKSDTITKILNIKPLPQVGFVLPEVCLADAAAVFTDTSKIADGTQAGFSYNWTFNVTGVTPGPTPATSTIKNGSTKFNKADNYQVKLKVTSAAGCVDSLTKAFTVNGSIPVADFAVLNAAALCSNTAVQIQNTSTVDFGWLTKVEIYWDVVGQPTVKFTDDDPQPNEIYTNLYANFQQPANKSYTIRFVAYSGGTCSNPRTKTITINASPKVQFVTMPGICLDATPRQITQATEVGGVAGASPAFAYYGTGVSSTGLFTPTNAGVGTFPIKYVYTSNTGCQDSATRNITVWPPPTANFGFSSPTCEKNPVTFSDSSVANFSNIVTWLWDFGNGNTQTNTSGSAFTYTYTNGNTYTATLKVTTDSGCVSTITPKTIKVNYLPVVNFSLPDICLPDGNGQFNDLSTIPDNSEALFAYRWDFNDPNDATPSTLKNPIHKYTALAPTGGYLVKLKITTKDGCVDSLTKPFSKVYPQPKADFKATPKEVCLGDSIVFTDLSDGKTSAVTQWRWNFGDGKGTSIQQNPVYTYKDSGSFIVNLFIYNAQNCVSDTFPTTVTIHPYPKIDAGPDLFVLESGTIQIKPNWFATNPSFLWTPSTYLDSDTLANPKSTPLNDITYLISLTGIGGCTDTSSVFIKVLRKPLIPNAFSPNGDGVNDTWSIEYLDSYPGATVEVFDRGGRLVFSSFGYTKNWDGTLNGKPLPVGTYYYIITPKNGRQPMSGYVAIIR
jgi:gliding motility-associated-like protein